MVFYQRIKGLCFCLTLGLSLLFAAGCAGEGAGGTVTAYEAKELGPRSYETGAMIYNGYGSADGSVNGLTEILEANKLSYDLINEDELNAMSVDEIAKYGVILIPGGYAGRMTRSLTPETRARVREAVIERGVGYAGFCAGSWMAVGPTREDGRTADYGFAIIPADDILPEFPPNGQLQNMDDGPMITVSTLVDKSTIDLVFWGGSYFPQAEKAIARYRDGKPSVVQATVGNGFLALTGPHPEADDSWRDRTEDSDGREPDYKLGWQLINAALTRTPLPTS